MTSSVSGSVPTSRAQSALGALKSNLEGSHQFDLQLEVTGLSVRNHQTQGCCAFNPGLSDFITCKPREEDGNRLWFFHSWGEPIAEHHRVIDAAVVIRSRLTPKDKQ